MTTVAKQIPAAALALLTGALVTMLAGPAQAQASCSSDGTPAASALMERFIHADCDACWRDAATPKPGAGALVLDWVATSHKGDDAPLSAVALRETAWRLQALGQPLPDKAATLTHSAALPALQLRVAHGVAVKGYMGVSITLTLPAKPPADALPWSGWLALVETVPAGVEGTPVARMLVRNTLQASWSAGPAPAPGQAATLVDSRLMSIPEGANPERLSVVGWLEDSRGRLLAAAQSHCRD